MTNAETPNNDKLATRARQARLAVLDLVERNKEQIGAEMAEQLLRRVTNAAAQLATQSALMVTLDALGIRRVALNPADITRSGQARTALRATATKLADPKNEVRDLVSTKSINTAVETAEQVSSRQARSIESSFVTFRRNERPKGIDDVVADGIEPLSLSLSILRLQRILGSEDAVAVEDFLKKHDEYLAAKREWEDLQTEIVAARRRLSSQMENFHRQVRNGVPWRDLTDEMRAWLDEGHNGNDFVLVCRDRPS